SIERISVLGGGAWGAALAETAVRAGRKVTLWEHDASNAESLLKEKRSKFLPDHKLHDSIRVTRELGDAAKADAILLVVPTQATRAVCQSLASLVSGDTAIVVC